jgi:hypothetical protein
MPVTASAPELATVQPPAAEEGGKKNELGHDIADQDTMIYHPHGQGRIVKRGHPIPEGWSTDPGVIADPKKRTAEAVSGVPKHARHAPSEE